MSDVRSNLSSSSSLFSRTPPVSVESTPREILFNILTLCQLIIDYAHATPQPDGKFENFESKDYSLAKVGFTLFENRLPVITLLNHVIRGEYKETDAILTTNPMLLLESDTVTDYSRRIHYKRTAYQLARGALDLDVINEKKEKVVDGMAEMIEGHFSRLKGLYLPNINRIATKEDIDQIIKKQYEGQFPKDFEEKEAKRAADDRAALHKVWGVITAAKEDDCRIAHEVDDEIQYLIWNEKGEVENQALHSIDQLLLKATTADAFEAAFEELKAYLSQNTTSSIEILKAIYQFRNHMEPKTSMTSGLHYNYRLSDEAETLYDRDYVTFGRVDGTKNVFCWRKVLGYIDRFIPACDAQVSAQSLYNIWEQSQKARRILDFPQGGRYFPLQVFGGNRLGYDCGNSWMGFLLPGTCVAQSSLSKKNYIQQKHRTAAELYQLVWAEIDTPELRCAVAAAP